MRSIDKDKDTLTGKAAATISFDKIVLRDLEKKAAENKTKVSSIVNMICRQHVLGDRNWHYTMMKEHMMQYHKHKYELDTLELKVE